MLYLVRKLDESIIINNNVEVKVIEIKRNSVKLGFTFPPTATVLRKEIHDRIAKENKQAATDFDMTVELDLPDEDDNIGNV
ncbi:MAG: carbon storage regulator CsrA [Rickettsiales bacterium]